MAVNKSTEAPHASCLQGFHCSDTSVCRSSHSRLCNMHISGPCSALWHLNTEWTPQKLAVRLPNIASLVPLTGQHVLMVTWITSVGEDDLPAYKNLSDCLLLLLALGGCDLAGSYEYSSIIIWLGMTNRSLPIGMKQTRLQSRPKKRDTVHLSVTPQQRWGCNRKYFASSTGERCCLSLG